MVEDLAQIPNIVGLKDSSGQLSYILAVLEKVRDKINVLSFSLSHTFTLNPLTLTTPHLYLLHTYNYIHTKTHPPPNATP
jgi:hypothetical protein